MYQIYYLKSFLVVFRFFLVWPFFSEPIFLGFHGDSSKASNLARFILKEGDLYYLASKHQFLLSSDGLRLRCCKSNDGCKFRANLQFLNVADCTDPKFFDIMNFRLEVPKIKGPNSKSKMGFQPHSCTGTKTPYSILGSESAFRLFSEKLSLSRKRNG